MTDCLAHATRLFVASAFLAGNAFAAATMPPQFNANNQTTGWVGEVEFTSFDFSSNNECLIKGDFVKASWTGNVFAIPVDKNGNLSLAASCWDSDFAESVNAQSLDFNNLRRIGTMKWGGARIPFLWGSLDGANQQAKIGDNTKGPKIVDYVRGDRSNELPSPGIFRKRGHTVLGDIVHSRPLYVYHPTHPRVFVGANDGMLHAIDACTGGCGTSGTEAWAYVPSMLIPNLKDLTSTTNPYPHRYFVDASPNARKIRIGSETKTILVGGVGPGAAGDAGGKLNNDPTKHLLTGLFALDITDPTASSDQDVADKILWEITNATINNVANNSYAQLGYTYGVPLIVRMNDGNWAAVVGNGYSQSDGGTGQAYLYVINLLTGAKIAELLATIGGAADDGHPNGLSSPTAIDLDNDGMVDYLYAGDLAGNLWKFDVRGANSGRWSAFKLFSTPNAGRINAEAITGAPSVALHPEGGYMVMFGTGRAFTNTGANDATHLNDLTNTTQQYAYGLRDTDFPASGAALSKAIDPTRLVDQTLSGPITFTSNSLTSVVRTSGAINPVDYTSADSPKQGWRLLLARDVTAATAECILGDGGLVAANRYHVSTSNPNVDNGSTDGVPNAKGDNWLLEVDFLTGTAPATPIFDLNVDTQLNDDDLVPDTGQTTKQLRIPVARRIIRGGLMSQPVLAALAANAQTYFNVNPDLAVTATNNAGGGVANGHFDFDIYYNTCTPSSGGYRCQHNTHVHEYDDKYNVTGVNMQNASLTAFNLKNAVPGSGTRFKILVANQFLSPAVNVKIGGAGVTDYVPVLNFQTPTDPRGAPPALGNGAVLGTSTPFSNALPVYSRAGSNNSTKLDSLYLNLPLGAFVQQDWAGYWATGVANSCDPATNPNCRVGLVPSQTGCVHANATGYTDITTATSLLPYGNLWMNGALTIQIIKESTPDAAIRLASSLGDKRFGYRLRTDTTSQSYQLAQYTIFWHHPNKKCYGSSGWGTTAAIAYPDGPSNVRAVSPAPGSDDPKDGSFTGPGGGTGGGGAEGAATPPGTATRYSLPDGTTITQYVNVNSDGSVTITIIGPDGTEVRTFPPGQGPVEGRKIIRSGRQSWKQIVRP